MFLGHATGLIAGSSTGVRPHGCCRGAMWISCRGRLVSWENSFLGDCGYKSHRPMGIIEDDVCTRPAWACGRALLLETGTKHTVRPHG